ncbi:cytochrome P450 [Sporichthya polymorpha]|uniref:cytochrome P450 n=1 Tax=Sporichthya polymorpha TaxID=35751 RepID=UPI00037D2BFC|nr:cytochrome P450 [Sporichthya polymorpha]
MTLESPIVPDGVADYDHTAPEFLSRMSEIGARLRATCPLARGSRFGGFWVVTRYEDVARVLRDQHTFSSRDGVVLPGLDGAARALPQESEAPAHTRYRAAFLRHLDKRAVARHEAAIRATTAALFDRMADQAEPDLVAGVAVPLPLIVSARVLGLPPEDEIPLRAVFADTVAAMSAGDPAALAEVLPRFAGFLGERLQAKAIAADVDLMTTIAAPTNGFTPDEQIALCIGFILAGQDTTAMAIANLLLLVGTDDQLRADLVARPDLRAGAIEESLRLFSPLQHLARTVSTEIELHDRILAPGDRIVVNLGAANADPDQFPAADLLDPVRAPNRHLAFGVGAHHCAGIHLARLELRAVLDAFCDRMPHHSVIGTRSLQMGTIYGPTQLRAVAGPA